MTTVEQGLAAYNTDADLRAAKMRMGAALPDEGWLGQYIKGSVSVTDAPVEFHLASGLAAIAAAIGNRAWFVGWGQRTFPHIWIVLVAGSSFMRKSTSIGLASEMLADSVPDSLLPGDFSREAMLDELAEQPWGMLVQNEFGEFLAKMKRDFMAGSQQTFTSLYDGRTLRRRTVKGGNKLINQPALTILSATTLEWLEGEITETDIAGGFIPRFAWVTATEKASDKGRGDEFPTIVRNELLTGLRRIADRGAAAAQFEPLALEAIDEWRRGFEDRAEGETHSVSIKGFGARLTTMAWKFAMLFALSDAAWLLEERVTVTERSALRAIAYVDLLYLNVAALVDDDIATTEDQRVFRRILKICAGKGVRWSDLLRHSGMQSAKLRPFVSTLIERGQLSSETRIPEEVGLDRQRQRSFEWLRTVHLRAQLRVQEFSHSDAYGSANGSANGSGDLDESELRTVVELEDEPEEAESELESPLDTRVQGDVGGVESAPSPIAHAPARGPAGAPDDDAESYL